LRCGTRFASLPQLFAEVLARLDAGAADETDPPPISAVELRTLVRFMSYSATTVALLPVLISEAHAGNYAPLAGQARTLLRELPESLSFPMSNSVTCTEDVPYADPATADLASTYLGTAIMDALKQICARWPVGSIDAGFKTPVVSDTPVLLLSGEYDPITPPAYAERVKNEGLGNSVHLVGRGQGHGLVGVGCVPRLLRAFLENPTPTALDANCLKLEPPTPFFLTLLGPAP
jgi:pimeloyl-ACP methyl ester carboxylesterase